VSHQVTGEAEEGLAALLLVGPHARRVTLGQGVVDGWLDPRAETATLIEIGRL